MPTEKPDLTALGDACKVLHVETRLYAVTPRPISYELLGRAIWPLLLQSVKMDDAPREALLRDIYYLVRFTAPSTETKP